MDPFRPFRKFVRKITGLCVICDFELTEKFPKDFPDDWKFCCSCLGWAKFYLENEVYYDSLFSESSVISPIIKKILDKINLVGNNG